MKMKVFVRICWCFPWVYLVYFCFFFNESVEYNLFFNNKPLATFFFFFTYDFNISLMGSELNPTTLTSWFGSCDTFGFLNPPLVSFSIEMSLFWSRQKPFHSGMTPLWLKDLTPCSTYNCVTSDQDVLLMINQVSCSRIIMHQSDLVFVGLPCFRLV